MGVPSAALSRNPVNTVAVLAAVLGSRTAEMSTIYSLVTHGMRALKPAKVFRILSRSKYHNKLYSVTWESVSMRLNHEVILRIRQKSQVSVVSPISRILPIAVLALGTLASTLLLF